MNLGDTIQMHKKLMIWAALAVACALPLTGIHGAARADRDDEKFLCAGGQARVKRGFLSVIDFDEHSRHYGTGA
jgi:hypothetical protein